MTELQATRTLVKSAPELWAECSDAASLARHLGQFGEIRITRLDPETAVAWEGEHARGTVRLEPAGWGTKVILTAVAAVERRDDPPPAEPVQDTESPAPARRRFARLRAWLRGEQSAVSEVAAVSEVVAVSARPPAPGVAAVSDPAPAPEAALNAALDSLGQAHHRPFSRA